MFSPPCYTNGGLWRGLSAPHSTRHGAWSLRSGAARALPSGRGIAAKLGRLAASAVLNGWRWGCGKQGGSYVTDGATPHVLSGAEPADPRQRRGQGTAWGYGNSCPCG
ncbi:MAG: hypothetical protein EOM37_08820 [Proteobacteria bacterium]|nr:hypothetical protein [Pseudomonadota bacterium]